MSVAASVKERDTDRHTQGTGQTHGACAHWLIYNRGNDGRGQTFNRTCSLWRDTARVEAAWPTGPIRHTVNSDVTWLLIFILIRTPDGMKQERKNDDEINKKKKREKKGENKISGDEIRSVPVGTDFGGTWEEEDRVGGARYCFPFRCIFPFHLGLRSRLFRSLLIPISSDGQKASRATKTTATTKGHTKPKLVGTEKDSMRG